MSKKAKRKARPKTVVTVEIDGEFQLDTDRKPVYGAVVSARRGDLGFAAEIEIRSLAEDLAQTIEHVNRVFFSAEADGLPEFPDLTAEPDAVALQPPTAEVPAEKPPASIETGPAQATSSEVVRDDEYYADLADRYEAERAAQQQAQASDDGYRVALYGPEETHDTGIEQAELPEGEQLSLLG